MQNPSVSRQNFAKPVSCFARKLRQLSDISEKKEFYVLVIVMGYNIDLNGLTERRYIVHRYGKELQKCFTR